MSSRTWTPDALASERRRLTGRCWRGVEAQHQVSTVKLVDSLVEQQLLEELLDATKPAVPGPCRHLHYLLSTPFRYGAPYPAGSRFRRPGHTPGVFYGSRATSTAVAELAFHRLLFFADSPETPWPVNPGEFTLFAAEIRTRAAIDLTRPPLDQDAARWTHATDYTACQELSDAARAAHVEVIAYRSVRDPHGGVNLALLSCTVFASPNPVERQTWRIDLSASGVRAVCAFPAAGLEFTRQTFAADPRVAALRWDRT
jgi:hypothetical protein